MPGHSFQLRWAAAGVGDLSAIKGPHARLAVRLQQRDGGREFVLGQRIQYVLLPGPRLQVAAPPPPPPPRPLRTPHPESLMLYSCLPRRRRSICI